MLDSILDMSERQLPVPNTERVEFYDLDPQQIAVFFGRTARLSHHEVFVDTRTGSEVGRDPVWEVIITEPTTLAQLIVFIQPESKQVGVVGRGGLDPARVVGLSRGVPLDKELAGPIIGTANIEGITKVEFSSSPFSEYKSVYFITKHGKFTAKLTIDSKAQFRQDVWVKSSLPSGVAIRIDENV